MCVRRRRQSPWPADSSHLLWRIFFLRKPDPLFGNMRQTVTAPRLFLSAALAGAPRCNAGNLGRTFCVDGLELILRRRAQTGQSDDPDPAKSCLNASRCVRRSPKKSAARICANSRYGCDSPALKSETPIVDRDHARVAADEVHLDGGFRLVPSRRVSKTVKREISLQFTIDPREEVEVEARRHPGRIVVGGGSSTSRPCADRRRRAPCRPRRRCPAHVAAESPRPPQIEVSDRRAGKECHAIRHGGIQSGNAKSALKSAPTGRVASSGKRRWKRHRA